MIAICIDEEKSKQYKSRCKVWKCQCDCGNITYVSIGNLKSGSTTSCGCYREELKQSHFKNLTGLKFNKLTVIELGEPYIKIRNKKMVGMKQEERGIVCVIVEVLKIIFKNGI